MAEALSQSDIESLLAAAASVPQPAGQSAQAVARRAHGRHVRKMDFARPSKFNKDQLRTLHMLHEAFCRRASTYLSATVRSLVEVNVTGAEQIPYGDFIASLPVPTFTSVLEISPLNTNAMASLDLPLVFGILDRMLGGPGASAANMRLRELTDIESTLASTMMSRLLDELTASWNDLVPVDFRLRGVEMNAQFAQIAASSDPSVLIMMELSIGTAAGTMSICLPYRSIEQIVGGLTAHRYFANGESADGDDGSNTQKRLLDSLRKVTMPVRAMVGNVSMPVDSVLALRPGDIVPLGRRVDEGIKLVVGKTRVYGATPGRDGKRLAVRIGERLAETPDSFAEAVQAAATQPAPTAASRVQQPAGPEQAAA